MLLLDDGACMVNDLVVTHDGFSQHISANVLSPSRNCGKAWPGGKPKRNTYGIVKVIFNNPATIVYWLDGTKTVVKCQPGDVYSKETGLYNTILCLNLYLL